MRLDGSASPRDGRFARRLFRDLPARYDRLAEWLSLGQNRRWRRAMVDHVADAHPRLVLDVATGTAGVAIQLAARTSARVVGVDLTEAMVRQGRRAVDDARCAGRVQLVVGGGERLPFADGTFDALTFTYLLRYVADPAATLRELARVVKPGGVVANLEFLVPERPFWHFWWWGYTRLVLPVAGALTGGRAWFDVGRFLGPSISAHYRRYPLDWTVRAWRAAGIGDVGVRAMSLGGGLVMWGSRSGG
ncbi:MAG TPA: class I SAM-dependent methyltransferase [Acidimicrobiales bacterium]|nr:class I SAM-dependent methyltransferase [Acidimicrobiales bacterium]